MFPYCLSQPELRLRRLLRHRHGADLRVGRRVVEEDRAGTCSAEYPPGAGPDARSGRRRSTTTTRSSSWRATPARRRRSARRRPRARPTAQAIAIVDPLDPATLALRLSLPEAGRLVVHRRQRLRRLRARRRTPTSGSTATASRAGDPEQLGSSNTGYGPNLAGTGLRADRRRTRSTDRFPRDGVDRLDRRVSMARDRPLDGARAPRREAGPAGRLRPRPHRPLEGPRLPAEPRLDDLARRLRGRAGELGGQRVAARRAHAVRCAPSARSGAPTPAPTSPRPRASTATPSPTATTCASTRFRPTGSTRRGTTTTASSRKYYNIAQARRRRHRRRQRRRRQRRRRLGTSPRSSTSPTRPSTCRRRSSTGSRSRARATPARSSTSSS